MKKSFVLLFCLMLVWVQVIPANAGHRYRRHHHRHHHHIDGKAAGIALGVLGFFGLLAAFSNALSQGTQRVAITEEHKTKREQIWASAVTAAPEALGGNGSAEYRSSNGFARISANVPFYGAQSRPRRKRCTKKQLKRNRVPWGTSGWLYGMESGRRCYYDLR